MSLADAISCGHYIFKQHMLASFPHRRAKANTRRLFYSAKMANLRIVIFVLAASMLTTEAGKRMNNAKKQCEKISILECANLGAYQRTKFPNKFTNITTQKETNSLRRFLPVLDNLNCTKIDAMPFLCSVYVPKCSRDVGVIPPCREFCEASVGSCPTLAASYGVKWPSPLKCSNYPSERGGKICINKLKSRKSKKGKKGKEF